MIVNSESITTIDHTIAVTIDEDNVSPPPPPPPVVTFPTLEVTEDYEEGLIYAEEKESPDLYAITTEESF